MIKIKANEFRSTHKINSDSSAEYLKMVIHKSGYNLLTYSEHKMKLISLNLHKKASVAPSLSVMDSKGKITVFYNDELPSSVQRLALAHEIGHIVLGHLNLEVIEDKEERDADKFADYLLAPKNNKNLTSVQISCLILCICISVISLYRTFTENPANQTDLYTSSSAVSSDTASDDTEKITDDTTCYYARYSEVYHLYRDCYYLKNSKTVYTDTVGKCELDRLCSACEHRRNEEKQKEE